MAKPDESEDIIGEVDEKITAVRTSSIDFSFNELADMHASGELIIDPEFQRMFRWNEGAQSRFIESLLLELPIPPIFLIEREDRIYELIDGLQRLSSYLHFTSRLAPEGEPLPPLELSDCDIIEKLNGYSYESLPRPLKIKLRRSYVRAEILRKESDPRLRYYMFKRLNTGGELLSQQEIRNATIRLLSNEFNSFMIDLSQNPDFVACTSIISTDARNRKFDQELVLRFFALKNDFLSYVHDVSEFLTDYMEKVSDPDDSTAFDFDSERAVFAKTFSILKKISDILNIDSRIFGTIGRGNEPRSQFSVYHFEGLSLGLQSVLSIVDLDDAEQLEKLAAVARKGKSDQEFLKHGGAGKNYRTPTRARIAYFADRFSAALR
ncbi:DUF262 domain-containing protein [Amycolatopsis roodepoortensis]|uniref:DUF262 domain-containing protein n=1 Tax=Amycolatopsis roodepoortensis TaxID=700274 RepID=UPI00214C269D|nr:DUF262 domain-containing protein [Amycolatopsis roodepoortensis]UUV35790.1 DUF262 domain-containing protein [Amycolatopsis roodepoortensis]